MRALLLIACLAVGVVALVATALPRRGSHLGASEPASPPSPSVDLSDLRLRNPSAYIPPQCYTRTRDEAGRAHNPCFVCHTRSRRPNYADDADLQLAYDLPEPATTNPWTNLFVDRRAAIEATTDADIEGYVREDNYRALVAALSAPPPAWDTNGDGRWGGFVPDAGFEFDDAGFDRGPDGRYTGWRALAYYPFPGTFWPTNGSAGDVLIRLPEVFRRGDSGGDDHAVHRLNLAILEAVIKREAVEIEPTDEARYGVDLDRDGALGTARQVTYDWAPLEGRTMSWVGAARAATSSGTVQPPTAGLFPAGTELLHTVRYLDVRDGQVTMATRMKEVRYARKVRWMNYSQLDESAAAEAKEAVDFPDRLRSLFGDPETGLGTGTGWVYQGFIEDAAGALRPQSFEETAFCVGCHGGVGATTDSVFSFARKLDAGGERGGWFHWSQRGLAGLAEPRRADGSFEYTDYLEHNGAGDELRDNAEVLARFFTADGALEPTAVEALHGDIATLLLPSPRRALDLDKAYRLVVREQSFARGRDARLAPAVNVYREVEAGAATGVEAPH